MSSISGGGNYISDGEIMAWLAQQQDRLYGDLRDSIQVSKARADFTNELNDIKTALHEANKTHDFRAVDQQMQELLHKYEGNPEFADLCEGLHSMTDTIRNDTQLRLDRPGLEARSRQEWSEFIRQGGDINGPNEQQAWVADPFAPGGKAFKTLHKPETLQPLGEQSYSDDQLKVWDELIAGKLDVSGKNDQLTMIHIQQLKATLDQGSQLASQFISSDDKASNSIIHNIA